MQTAKKHRNPLHELEAYGQSVWLDFIRRNLLTGGELKRMVDEDGLKGMTSNPSIFQKAIAGSNDYTEALNQLKKDSSLDEKAIYEKLAIDDIRQAADILRPVYKNTAGKDGYVSIEVSPYLARDTEGTIAEAERLWKTIERPNIMIKVPGTVEGIPAIKHLIGNGINVNVTLLFAQKRYEEVAEAFISGMEHLEKSGGDVSRVASVASFFVSRIDTMIDARLEEMLKETGDAGKEKQIRSIIGKIAIANAKLTYQKYLEIYKSERWKKLEAKGAHTQRLLWASTSTKNPSYPDTIYVDELIGKDTVNTIPPQTFEAFRDHGKLRNSLTEDIEEARSQMKTLADLGISIKEITDALVTQGVDLFVEPFQQLLDTIEAARTKPHPSLIDRITYKLPDDLEKGVNATISEWQHEDKMKRLWARDAHLWTNEDEGKWLDWLNLINDHLAHVDNLKKLAEWAKEEKLRFALLMGMGGSSLCPEVMAMTFGRQQGHPELVVLDSTDPQQIRTIEKKIDLKSTLFIVASKSGTTLEPNIFEQYFWQRAVEVLGDKKAGERFVAVTDPGSKLESQARQKKFHQIFHGLPGVGGRYSALSNFGMVPAAVMGVNIERFLSSAREMALACAATVAVRENPGAVLGIILGTAALGGRDKVTIVTSNEIRDLGAWLEQLLAESTGKKGRGIIPVDRERLAHLDKYGEDRLFVYLSLENSKDKEKDELISEYEKHGRPVVRIVIPDIYCLGEEFFRWEMATAVAGAVIGINAFDQPDVEASKVATRELTSQFEKTGKLPEEKPIFEEGGIKLFADEANRKELENEIEGEKTLSSYLKSHFFRLKPNDYFALLAYVEMNEENEKTAQELRHLVRDGKKAATCLGFGPRFLHSTGQAYKGGPNKGVFLQITADDAHDLQVPSKKYSFGVVKAAQARGDLAVLEERSRRVLRAHLGKDVAAGMRLLVDAARKALS